jgi:hypothetical protein
MNDIWKRLIAAGAVVVFSIVPIASFAEVNMQEGNWETTMESMMEGMPFPMPPVTSKVTQCITKKDLVPKTAGKDQTCDIKDQKVSGNKVSWKMVCVDKKGTMEGQGEITYAGHSYQGTVKTRMTTKERPKEAMTSTMKMQGRRLGACPK